MKKKIGDPIIITLLWKYLKTGFQAKGVSHKGKIGVPQGGLLSPLLANIVLDKFDKYMEKSIERYNTGESQKINRDNELRTDEIQDEQSRYNPNVNNVKKDGERQKFNMDRTTQRMEYIRYADDFVIFISGSLNVAKRIKANIKEYLSSQCGATLSDKKTTINNLKENEFVFLGADIIVKKSTSSIPKDNNKVDSVKRLEINAPISKLVNKLIEEKFVRRNDKGIIL